MLESLTLETKSYRYNYKGDNDFIIDIQEDITDFGKSYEVYLRHIEYRHHVHVDFELVENFEKLGFAYW